MAAPAPAALTTNEWSPLPGVLPSVKYFPVQQGQIKIGDASYKAFLCTLSGKAYAKLSKLQKCQAGSVFSAARISFDETTNGWGFVLPYDVVAIKQEGKREVSQQQHRLSTGAEGDNSLLANSLLLMLNRAGDAGDERARYVPRLIECWHDADSIFTVMERLHEDLRTRMHNATVAASAALAAHPPPSASSTAGFNFNHTSGSVSGVRRGRHAMEVEGEGEGGDSEQEDDGANGGKQMAISSASRSQHGQSQSQSHGHGQNQTNVLAAVSGCLPEADVRRYCSHVLKALSLLHSIGWVHKDVSPENIAIRLRPSSSSSSSSGAGAGAGSAAAAGSSSSKTTAPALHGGYEDDDSAPDEAVLFDFGTAIRMTPFPHQETALSVTALQSTASSSSSVSSPAFALGSASPAGSPLSPAAGAAAAGTAMAIDLPAGSAALRACDSSFPLSSLSPSSSAGAPAPAPSPTPAPPVPQLSYADVLTDLPKSGGLGGWMAFAPPPKGGVFCKKRYADPGYTCYQPYWGVAFDLWSLAQTAFAAVVSRELYEHPSPELDFAFNLLVRAEIATMLHERGNSTASLMLPNVTTGLDGHLHPHSSAELLLQQAFAAYSALATGLIKGSPAAHSSSRPPFHHHHNSNSNSNSGSGSSSSSNNSSRNPSPTGAGPGIGMSLSRNTSVATGSAAAGASASASGSGGPDFSLLGALDGVPPQQRASNRSSAGSGSATDDDNNGGGGGGGAVGKKMQDGGGDAIAAPPRGSELSVSRLASAETVTMASTTSASTSTSARERVPSINSRPLPLSLPPLHLSLSADGDNLRRTSDGSVRTSVSTGGGLRLGHINSNSSCNLSVYAAGGGAGGGGASDEATSSSSSSSSPAIVASTLSLLQRLQLPPPSSPSMGDALSLGFDPALLLQQLQFRQRQLSGNNAIDTDNQARSVFLDPSLVLHSTCLARLLQRVSERRVARGLPALTYQFRDLLLRLFRLRPGARPVSAAAVMAHPWFVCKQPSSPSPSSSSSSPASPTSASMPVFTPLPFELPFTATLHPSLLTGSQQQQQQAHAAAAAAAAAAASAAASVAPTSSSHRRFNGGAASSSPSPSSPAAADVRHPTEQAIGIAADTSTSSSNSGVGNAHASGAASRSVSNSPARSTGPRRVLRQVSSSTKAAAAASESKEESKEAEEGSAGTQARGRAGESEGKRSEA